MGITVREALQLGALRQAKLVGGASGLDNVIEYVSVIEVPDASRWFQGRELFVTACYAYRDDVRAQVRLIEDLVHKGASALAICYADRYLKGIPHEVVRRTDDLGLPLLELPLEVKYIDIITPVLGAILEKRTRQLEYSAQVRSVLEDVILGGGRRRDVLQRFAELLGCVVVAADRTGVVIGYASMDPARTRRLVRELAPWALSEMGRVPSALVQTANRLTAGKERWRREVLSGQAVLVVPVPPGTGNFGLLLLWEQERALGDLDYLAVEQGATVLALEVAKEDALSEAQKRLRLDFLDQVLHAGMSSESIVRRGMHYGIDMENRHVVILVEIDPDGPRDPSATPARVADSARDQVYAVVEKALGAMGTDCVIAPTRDRVVVIPRLASSTDRERILEAAITVANQLRYWIGRELPGTSVSLGIGRPHAALADLHRSHKEAEEAIRLGRRLLGPGNVVPFDKLGSYSLLGQLVRGTDSQSVREFIDRTWGRLEEYDRRHRTQLAPTLETLFACGGNVQEASKRLFIHRNTLRYRQQKIREITGYDPASAPDRFDLQVGLALRRLLG